MLEFFNITRQSVKSDSTNLENVITDIIKEKGDDVNIGARTMTTILKYGIPYFNLIYCVLYRIRVLSRTLPQGYTLLPVYRQRPVYRQCINTT